MRLFVKIRLKRWISTRTCIIVESIRRLSPAACDVSRRNQRLLLQLVGSGEVRRQFAHGESRLEERNQSGSNGMSTHSSETNQGNFSDQGRGQNRLMAKESPRCR